jgi:fluoroacetyl-CoA thioesterase
MPDNVVTIGMTAEKIVTMTSQMTIGHFAADMSQVYATPITIMHMELAAGAAIASHLPEGFVAVGTWT